jgi:hypothetical protein
MWGNILTHIGMHHTIRGSAHTNLTTREKLIPTKSQKLVQPSLLRILLLCFSDSSNYLLMGVQNWNNPTLAGVKLSLFCQFWQQHHVPQIGRCMRCLDESRMK